MNRRKIYTERFEVCITKHQKEALERAAKAQEVTMNELLRELINNYLS